MSSGEISSTKEIEYCAEFDIDITEENPVINTQFISNFLTALKHKASRFVVYNRSGNPDSYHIVTAETASDLRHSPRNVAIFEMFTQNTCVTLKHMDILNSGKYNSKMSSSTESSHTDTGSHLNTVINSNRASDKEKDKTGKLAETSSAVIQMDDSEETVMSLREIQEMLMRESDSLNGDMRNAKVTASRIESRGENGKSSNTDKSISRDLNSANFSSFTNEKQEYSNERVKFDVGREQVSSSANKVLSETGLNQVSSSVNKTKTQSVPDIQDKNTTDADGLASKLASRSSNDAASNLRSQTQPLSNTNRMKNGKLGNLVVNKAENKNLDEMKPAEEAQLQENIVKTLLSTLYKRMDPNSIQSGTNENQECGSIDAVLGNEKQLSMAKVAGSKEEASEQVLETKSMMELHESSKKKGVDIKPESIRINKNSDYVQFDKNPGDEVTMIVENSAIDDEHAVCDAEKTKGEADDIIIHIKFPEKNNGFKIMWQNNKQGQKPGISVIPREDEDNTSQQKEEARKSEEGESVEEQKNDNEPHKGRVKDIVSYYEKLFKGG